MSKMVMIIATYPDGSVYCVGHSTSLVDFLTAKAQEHYVDSFLILNKDSTRAQVESGQLKYIWESREIVMNKFMNYRFIKD